MDVLVVDVGGSHVKLCATGQEPKRFSSGPELTPEELVRRVREKARDWKYDVISLGIPGVISRGAPAEEPGNLGEGWVDFDFERAFDKPVRIVNDAVMQALGGYKEGRMLFLGLGTGLGSALVTEHVVVPLELGNLPFGNGETIAERVGRAGLKSNGPEQWMADVHQVTRSLREAFAADYVLLGGGNAKLVDPLPDGAYRGGNQDAFAGGFRLCEEVVEQHDAEPHRVWRVVR